MAKRIKTRSIYETKTPVKDVSRPINTMFQKIRSYSSPLLRFELMRKRRKVVARH